MQKPSGLTHVDAKGRVRMVDVGAKPDTAREAVASGHVAMSAATRRALKTGQVKKGDPLQTARLAGIVAAKMTSAIVPLCHPLALTGIEVDLRATARGVAIRATVRTFGKTGVEMEALTAVSVAALTVYDMLKAIDKGMVIEHVQLEEKSGGRTGQYRRAPASGRNASRR
jgi:cyclic pyranopterin monophosphate synthase